MIQLQATDLEHQGKNPITGYDSVARNEIKKK